jgi:hypothetical protein
MVESGSRPNRFTEMPERNKIINKARNLISLLFETYNNYYYVIVVVCFEINQWCSFCVTIREFSKFAPKWPNSNEKD